MFFVSYTSRNTFCGIANDQIAVTTNRDSVPASAVMVYPCESLEQIRQAIGLCRQHHYHTAGKHNQPDYDLSCLDSLSLQEARDLAHLCDQRFLETRAHAYRWANGSDHRVWYRVRIDESNTGDQTYNLAICQDEIIGEYWKTHDHMTTEHTFLTIADTDQQIREWAPYRPLTGSVWHVASEIVSVPDIFTLDHDLVSKRFAHEVMSDAIRSFLALPRADQEGLCEEDREYDLYIETVLSESIGHTAKNMLREALAPVTAIQWVQVALMFSPVVSSRMDLCAMIDEAQAQDKITNLDDLIDLMEDIDPQFLDRDDDSERAMSLMESVYQDDLSPRLDSLTRDHADPLAQFVSLSYSWQDGSFSLLASVDSAIMDELQDEEGDEL